MLVAAHHRDPYPPGACSLDQIIIEGNIIEGWGAPPDIDVGSSGIPFNHDGIYFGGGVNAQIRGNDLSAMWDGNGLRLTADWEHLDLTVTDNRIWNVGRTGIQAQSIPAQGSTPAGTVKRCRIAGNNIGPCGGRGIWLNGDYNVVESNHIHQCGTAPALWEGLYIEGGLRNSVRRNRLVDCLALADHARETQAVENDQFWDTRQPA